MTPSLQKEIKKAKILFLSNYFWKNSSHLPGLEQGLKIWQGDSSGIRGML